MTNQPTAAQPIDLDSLLARFHDALPACASDAPNDSREFWSIYDDLIALARQQPAASGAGEVAASIDTQKAEINAAWDSGVAGGRKYQRMVDEKIIAHLRAQLAAAPAAPHVQAEPVDVDALRAKVARLTVELGAAQIRINKYERAVAASVEALAARAPVPQEAEQAAPAVVTVTVSPPECVMRALIEDAVANHNSSDGYVKLALSYFSKFTIQPAAPAVTDAARDVLAERKRQVEVEGWTASGDDRYTNDELPRAAACYCINAPSIWPWRGQWWKPAGKRRNLVKAGALILAEIERIDRAALRTQSKE